MADIFDLKKAVEATSDGWSLLGSTVAAELVDIKYEEPVRQDVPLQIVVTTFTNDTDEKDTVRFADTRSTTALVSWTVTQGVSTTLSANASIGVPGSMGASVGASQTASLSRTDAQTFTTQQTWPWDVTMAVPPRSRIDVEVLVDQIAFRSVFSARAVHSGRLWFVLLSPYPSDQKYVGVGEHFTRHPDPRVTVLTPESMVVDVSGVVEGRQGRAYRIEKHQHPINEPANVQTSVIQLVKRTLLVETYSIPRVAGAEIGNPDGIHYTIVSTSETTRPSPACGFNDLGLPNPAVFTVENRYYQEYSDGKVLRAWSDEVEIFKECVPV